MQNGLVVAFVQRFKSLNKGKGPKVKDLTIFIDEIITSVQKLTGPATKDILFRIFYYDCRPFGDKVKNTKGSIIDYSKTPQFIAATNFHQDLRTYPQMALRLGELSFDGWKLDPTNPKKEPKPDFKQKSVDMKIGLDIAWMASNCIVDKLVLVAGDSDFVSPMKFARRSGIIVYLYTMQQKQIKMVLKEHADFIL